MPLKTALIDAGPLVAYYNTGDEWHKIACKFWEEFSGQLITTEAICTEVMSLLEGGVDVENEFLSDLAREVYRVEPLSPADFKLIAELNVKYRNVPADFGDLSLVVMANRLGCADVVSLDSDFDIYRRLNKGTFNQIFPKNERDKRKK